MPQPFNSAVITNAGAQLITRVQLGENIKIEFTRIAVGDGVYTEYEKEMSYLQEQIELKSQKNSYTLSDISIQSEHSIKVTAVIANQNAATGEALIDEGYYINEIGLFARFTDGENSAEVLYSIAVTSGENGDFMPPYNGYSPAQIIQDYYVTVSNSADITICTAGAVPTVQQVRDAIKQKADLGANNRLLVSQLPELKAEVEPQTLTAGQTTLTFVLDEVKENDRIEILANEPDVGYEALEVSGNSITVTFEAMTKDIMVKVVVYNELV